MDPTAILKDQDIRPITSTRATEWLFFAPHNFYAEDRIKMERRTTRVTACTTPKPFSRLGKETTRHPERPTLNTEVARTTPILFF